jgi:transcription antitermination factor NusG
VPDWTVVMTFPARERKTVDDFADHGIGGYCPCEQITEAINGRIVNRVRPLFPTYIFVEFTVNLINVCGRIASVISLLMSGERPFTHCRVDDDKPVPIESVVEELRRREADDGFIKLHEKKRRRFRKGNSARIKEGPFQGFSGVVTEIRSRDRYDVLIEIFGRMTPATFEDAQLTVI